MIEKFNPIGKEFDKIKSQSITLILKTTLHSSESANRFINCLTIRELQVFHHRFFNTLTLTETGKELNLSRGRVKQIEDKAILKLKRINPLISKIVLPVNS